MDKKKSLSQQIARFLVIVNLFLLIPTTLIELAAIYFGLAAFFRGDFTSGFFLVGGVSLVYCFGTLLFYGYYNHFYGKIDKTMSLWLWSGTIVFNFVPVVVMFASLFESGFGNRDENNQMWFYNIFGAYQIAVLLAVAALIDDIKRDFD